MESRSTLLVSILVIFCGKLCNHRCTALAVNALSKNETRCLHDMPNCNTQPDFSLCCPYVDGICCDDGHHCCPKHTECLSSKGLCMGRTQHGIPDVWQVRSYAPLHPQGPKHPVRPELCPTKKQACPSKSTCCPGPYIGHDCCPLHRAVCCSDFRSCCPADHTCDLVRGDCVAANGQRVALFDKLRASRVNLTHAKKVAVIRRPNDHNHRPPHTMTCRDSNAVTPITCDSRHKCCSAGCCQYNNGVCCADGATCCPSGATCNTTTLICTNINGTSTSAATLIKNPSRARQPSTPTNGQEPWRISRPTEPDQRAAPVSVTVCPGGEYTCPTYMTCCKSGSQGKYGCCPFPNANCCSDNWHCCPQGAVCNLEKDRCDRGGLFIPMFRKIDAAKVTLRNPEMIATTFTTKTPIKSNATQTCPDQFVCPDDYTCCQMPNTKYGCCPLTAAVCCSDHVHCCPHGTICDLAVGGCRKSFDFKPLRTFKTETTSPHVRLRVPKSECPNNLCRNGSCCKLTSGWWGCCDHKEGVCCGDGTNCCPKDNKCDMTTGMCVSKNETSPFYKIA